MSRKQVIKKFKKFIAGIKPTDRVAVLHHTDCDGICSGFIVAEALARLGIEPALVEPRRVKELNSSLAKKLRRQGVTKTICVDLMIDHQTKTVKQISEFSDLLIIDHHPRRNTVFNSNVVVIKQTDLGIDYYYPASKLAYDLFLEVVDIKDLDWVAAVGLVGDSGFPWSKRFVHGVMKKYNIISAAELFETDIGKAASYINAASAVVPDRIKLALCVLKKAKHPKDVLGSELASMAKKVRAERDRQIEFFKKNAEAHGDLLIYEIKSKYKIKSAVITVLSFDHFTDKTLIIFQRSKDFCTMSARRQDRKLAVNDLLERATASLENAVVGGHAPAAGGSIMAKDFDRFKENLLRVHKKLSAVA